MYVLSVFLKKKKFELDVVFQRYWNKTYLSILLNYCIFTLPYSVWSSIVIVHEKSVFFFASFFRNISKTRWNYFDKKNWAKPWHFGLQKALISDYRKNYIFRDNNCFVQMSVSLCVTNLYGRASSKTSVNIKTKFHTYFWSIEIKNLNQKCMVKLSGWRHIKTCQLIFFTTPVLNNYLVLSRGHPLFGS